MIRHYKCDSANNNIFRQFGHSEPNNRRKKLAGLMTLSFDYSINNKHLHLIKIEVNNSMKNNPLGKSVSKLVKC